MRRFFIVALSIALGASTAHPAEVKKITYDEHVLPIFRDKCIACHDPDKAKGGLTLNNYTKVMAGGSSGEVVKPGDPDGSRLFQTVAHKQQPFMPPKSDMIPVEMVEVLRQWIAGG